MKIVMMATLKGREATGPYMQIGVVLCHSLQTSDSTRMSVKVNGILWTPGAQETVNSLLP
jgi:hypothetical protein